MKSKLCKEQREPRFKHSLNRLEGIVACLGYNSFGSFWQCSIGLYTLLEIFMIDIEENHSYQLGVIAWKLN